MEIAIALLALLVGAALGWFIAQTRTAATSERARLATEQVGKLDAELTALRARATELEAERGALKEAQSKLIESFKALSADALRSNNQSFLKLARESFGKLHQQSADELGKRQQAIDCHGQAAEGIPRKGRRQDRRNRKGPRQCLRPACRNS
jgi:DNA recombination protein RmuC